jgi:hypothetical protein
MPILMYQMRIATTSTTLKISSVVLRPKKSEIRRKKIVKTVQGPKNTKCYAMKLNQICGMIELFMREIILPLKMNL